MFLLVVLLPFFSFITLALFGGRFGKHGSSVIASLLMFITLILTFSIFFEVLYCNGLCSLEGSLCSGKFITWVDVLPFCLAWGFLFNYLTVVMLVVVNFISFFVHLYSISYMSSDPHLSRFLSYLSLFTFFMLLLVTAPTFVQMFIGWEGVGICSYLLINFWFMRVQAVKAGLKAILVNRVGDFFFLFAVLLIYATFGTVDFLQLEILIELSFLKINFFEIYTAKLFFIGFCLFCAAVGKSAQIFLHTWLPDAMEGPTPVSALIHAATMVTAGIFLVLRSSVLFESNIFILHFVLLFGGLTSLFAATTGLFQNDFKKVIAYSTCSQLGYMFFSCGMSNYSVALYHLANHAFFKAVLFLGAGVVIHSFFDEQDMRRMGGFFSVMPLVGIIILIGSMALVSFPFFTGFYSKDFILELMACRYNVDGFFVYVLGTVAAFFTIVYSIRVFLMVFLSPTRGSFGMLVGLHNSTFLLVMPLLFLGFASIFIGFVWKDVLVGFGSSIWASSLSMSSFFFSTSEFINIFWKLAPLIVSAIAILVAFFMMYFFVYYFFVFLRLQLVLWYVKFIVLCSFFSKKWFFDNIYNWFIVRFFLNISFLHFFKMLDRGIFEFFGPWGLILFVYRCAFVFLQLQTGFLFHYFLLFGFFFFSLLFFIGGFFYFSVFSFFFISLLQMVFASGIFTSIGLRLMLSYFKFKLK